LNPSELRNQIEAFLRVSIRPILVEPGEAPLPLVSDRFGLEERGGNLVIQAWDENRNLVRRIRGIEKSERGKLSLAVERFGKRQGTLVLADLANPHRQEWERRGARLVFRERLRKMLSRALPEWTIRTLSAEADLHHSLSPAYSRALLTKGRQAIAAIAAPPECGDFPAMLSFGLIWLDYVRRRQPKRSVEALLFWAPSGVAAQLSFYLPLLDSRRAHFAIYLYSDDDFAAPLDPRDYGNVATKLDICRDPDEIPFFIEKAEAVTRNDGSLSLRVAGLEFARYAREMLWSGGEPLSLAEARALAANISSLRNPAADRGSQMYQQNPEAWLESVVRSHLHVFDASLVPSPLYGQVPAVAGQSRTVIDLLAVDYSGRLAVLELKAAQDLHLPLQALDYWLRVKCHLDRDEFSKAGYFPGTSLRQQPPRLVLIAPSLEFHPTTETILRYLAPQIEVSRIGLNADWRANPKVMFRLNGSELPPAQ